MPSVVRFSLALVLRRLLFLGALLGLGTVQAAGSLRVGVPEDVADDLGRFLQGRDVASLQHFGGAHSRRDVVELAWLLREIKRQPDAPDVQLVRINSYQRLLAELRVGNIDVIGTTAWLTDLDIMGRDSVAVSAAMIPRGRFVVGVYTAPNNVAALRVRAIGQLRGLRFASNSGWTADWSTLRTFGIEPRFDLKAWEQMVKVVCAGRADALLAPFQTTTHAMELRFEDRILVPIDGIAVALDGSRHLASSQRSAHGQWIASRVFPELEAQARSGAMQKAYEESGFYTPRTRGWVVF